METGGTVSASSFSALRNRDYLVFVAGNAASLIGSWTHRVAAGWLTWEMTQSPSWLGLIAFADLFPTLLLAPFAGIVADRFSRLSILRIVQTVALLPALSLAALSLGGLLDIWLLFTFTCLLGAVQALEQPARLALITELVDRGQVRSAVAINSIVFNLARFAGPALAGAIIAFSTSTLAFVLNASSFALFLLALRWMSAGNEAPAAEPRRSLGVDLAECWRYILQQPGIYLVLLLIGALNLGARPILEMLPAFADRQFHSDAAGFAVLGSSVGIGAMIGGLGLTILGGRWSNTNVALVSTAGILVTSVAFILVPWLLAGAVFVAALGGFLATSGIAMQSVIQLSTAAEMRGRVLSIYGLLFRAAPAVGGLAIGYLSEYLGLQWPVVLGCVLIAAVSMLALSRRNEIARMDSTSNSPMG